MLLGRLNSSELKKLILQWEGGGGLLSFLLGTGKIGILNLKYETFTVTTSALSY